MITIYDISGTAILSVPVTKDCVHEEEMMKSNFVKLSWDDRSRMVLPVGAYILIRSDKTAVLDGETIGQDEEIIKYRLFDPYAPKADKYKKFKYEPKFQHPVMWLGRIPFFHLQGDTSSKETATKKYDWTYSGYASTIADELVKFINTLAEDDAFKEVFGDGWTAKVAANLTSTASCSFSSLDVLSAAAEIANKYDCEYHFDFEHKIFFLGNHGEDFTLSLEDEKYTPLVLKSGDNVGVVSVSESKEDYHNAFVVQGSTRNLSTKSASGDNVQVTERLHLDDTSYPDSIIYVDNDGNEKTRDEFLELGLPLLTKELIFDDVYPKLDLYLYNIRERKCWLLDKDSGAKIPDPNQDDPTKSSQMVDGIYYKTYSLWYFRLVYKVGNEWKDYLIRDEVFCNITGKETVNGNKIISTDMPYDSSYFTDTFTADGFIVGVEVGGKESKTVLVFRDDAGYCEVWYASDAYEVATVGDRLLFTYGVASGNIPTTHKTSVLIKDKNLSIAFQPNYDSKLTSPLAGREFELVYHKEGEETHKADDISDKKFSVNAGDYEIVYVEDDYVIPTPHEDGLFPKGYDYPSTENNKATLFNIAVDEQWKKTAQSELKAEALGEIAHLFSDLNTYSFDSNPIKFKADNPNLRIGQRVIYDNGQGLIGKKSYTLDTLVRKLVTRLDHPQIVSITVGNEKRKGNIKTMKEQIEALIVGGYGTGTGGSISESQFLQLLKNYGRQYFLRKDQDDTTPYTLTMGRASVTGDATVGGSLAVTDTATAATIEATGQVKTDTITAREDDKVTVQGDMDVAGDEQVEGNLFVGDYREATETDSGSGVRIFSDGRIYAFGTQRAEGAAPSPYEGSRFRTAVFGTYVPGLITGAEHGVAIYEEGDIKARSLALSSFLEVPEIRFNRATVYIGIGLRSVGGGIIEEVIPDPDPDYNPDSPTAEHPSPYLSSGRASLKLEDGEYGAIDIDDFALGFWHNEQVNSATGERTAKDNAAADLDPKNGDYELRGFQSIYFRITGIYATKEDWENDTSAVTDTTSSRGANKYFRYTLRGSGYGNVPSDYARKTWSNHPHEGMHFGQIANPTNTDRQALTVTTTEYELRLMNMTTWNYDSSNIRGIDGKLDGFSMTSQYWDPAIGQYVTYTKDFTGNGTVLGNAYIYGEIDQFERLAHRMVIDQSLNGSLAPGETETVTCTILDGYNRDVTASFTKYSVTRSTGDDASDALWNALHTNVGNPFQISFSDLGIDGIHKLLTVFTVTATDEATDNTANSIIDYQS